MALTQLARSRWQGFFDDLSRGLHASTATVEVTGLGLGGHLAAEWVPWHGISYEPEADMLTLFLEGLEHRIAQPRTIHVEQDDGAMAGMEVVDAQGQHHVVLLGAAVPLPLS